MTKKLRKGAFLTDIHFGKKSNSDVHNQDCLNFIDWFCQQVQEDPEIDYIGFLGDWNENRSALNIATLNYSYKGAKKLNDLGLPVFFVVGNHDLYHRHTREIHSIVPFQEFSNFTVIDEPKVFTNIGNGALLSPYLFHEEYANLANMLTLPFWAGHFEFKGFRVTGYNVLMPTGPDHTDFAGPKAILSGHFHQRQIKDNIVYTGNCFPMDFGDAGDFERGMTKYSHVDESIEFIDWPACPKYIKVSLSDILDDTAKMYQDARVKCLVDVPVSFEESTFLKASIAEKYNLREFTMEESSQLEVALRDTQTTADTSTLQLDKLDTVDDLVIQMLNDIKSDEIDNSILVAQYQRLIRE